MRFWSRSLFEVTATVTAQKYIPWIDVSETENLTSDPVLRGLMTPIGGTLTFDLTIWTEVSTGTTTLTLYRNFDTTILDTDVMAVLPSGGFSAQLSASGWTTGDIISIGWQQATGAISPNVTVYMEWGS